MYMLYAVGPVDLIGLRGPVVCDMINELKGQVPTPAIMLHTVPLV